MGFAFGLVAGIYAIRRRNLPFAIIGTSFCLATACVQLNVVSIIIGILAIVFTSMARHEFHQIQVVARA